MEDAIVIILFAVFSVLFLCMCVHCARAQMAERRRIDAIIIARGQPCVTEGIDPSTFPIVKYSDVKDVKIGKGIGECAVCLTAFADEDLVRLLPECDHVFHQTCIEKWLASHANCPVCRTKLIPAPESHNSGVFNGVAIHIDGEDDDRRRSTIPVSSAASNRTVHVQSREMVGI